MRSKLLVAALAVLTLVGWSMPRADAADPKRFQIFVVIHNAGSGSDDGFRDYLTANGVDADFIVRNIENDATKIPGIVAEIKESRPDLIYAQTTSVTVGIAGRNGTDLSDKVTDIPIVFALVSEPETAGLAPVRASEDAPLLSGRNLTGTRHVVSARVRLNAMRAFVPFKRLGMLYDASARPQRAAVEEMKKLAEEFGIELVLASPTTPDNKRDVELIVPTLETLASEKPELLYIPPSDFFGAHAQLVTETATRLGLATFCGVETLIRHHCLTGLVSPLYAAGQFAGYKAEQILKDGKNAGEIPIETLSRFSFVVNMETAHRLGVYPPMEILRFAQFIKVAKGS